MRSRPAIAITAALGGALSILLLAPALGDWSQSALGLPCGQAPDELWHLWSAVGGLGPESTRLGFPGAPVTWPLSAPAVLPVFTVLAKLLGGAVLAWNTLIAVGMALLTVGTIMLGHRISPNSPLIARITLTLAVVGAASWSPMVRHLGIGVVPMMTVPLAIALIDRWIQPQASRSAGAIAAAVTAFSCLGHWTTTVFVLAMIIPMIVLQCRHLEGKDVWRRATLAVAPGLAMGAVHIASNSSASSALSIDATLLGSAWIYRLEGALLLPATAATSLPALGMLLLALAGVAARAREAAGWLLVGAWGVLLAAGIGPDGFESLAPAHHLSTRLPPLANLLGWWGVAPLVALPFGITAMFGVEALHKVRRERLAMGVLILALVDQTLPAVTTSGPQTFAASPSIGVVSALTALPPGGVLQLPLTKNRCDVEPAHRLWQRAHDRPVSTPPPGGRDGGTSISYLARLLANQALSPHPRASNESPIDPDVFLCAKSDLKTLVDLGFSAVVLDHTAGAPATVTDTLRMVLGPPAFADETAVVWALTETETEKSPPACALPAPLF